MANTPFITPGYLLQAQRFNNGLDPSGYDPSNTVDPMQAIAVQQQYAKSLLQYQQQLQNPRLALPQQFGAALGGAVQGWLPQSMQAQQPQQPAQQAQGPQTDQGKFLHQAAVQLMQQNPGMSMAEALYKAADQTDASGTYDNDPTMAKVLDHARDWAKKNGYNPTLESEEKVKAQYKSAEQFKNKSTGEVVLAQPGSDLYKHIVGSRDYVKLGETPQLTPGSLHTFDKNGLIQTAQVDGNGNLNTNKPVAKSTAPIQYGATVTGPDAQAAWPGGPKTFDNANAAEVTKGLTNRSIATKNLLDGIDLLDKTASGSSIGTPGDINEKVNNARATIGTLAGQLGLSSDPKDYKMVWSPKMGGQLDKWRKAGIDAEQVKSLFLQTALLDEATNGDKNASDANRKFSVEQHMKILGEDSSDPAALHATLMQRRAMAISQLNNEFEGKPNVMSKPPWLQAENEKSKPPTQASVKAGAPQEGAKSTSKSGKPIVFKNGHWQYSSQESR